MAQGKRKTTKRKVTVRGAGTRSRKRTSSDDGALIPSRYIPGYNLLVGRRKRKRKQGAWYHNRALWMYLGSAGLTVLIGVLALVAWYARGLPSIDDLDKVKKQPGITMKTADGMILAGYGDIYGEYVKYEDLPKHLVDAVVATEDRRFFHHSGIDVFGILRAGIKNMIAGRVVQGGSTITQQVAKNVFLTADRKLKRKIQEMLLAFWLESRFSKEEILAIYLNRVYLGAGNFGIDAASRRYFGKSAKEMNLIESAQLTGLLKAPSKYSPLADAERSKKRAHQVLLNMVDADVLEKEEVAPALAAFKPPTTYREGDATGSRYFTDWVVDEIPEYIGQTEDDIEVTVTLDTKMQTLAEDVVKQVMEKEGPAKNASQAALVSMTKNGAIRAMVGGLSYKESQFNRAAQSLRQPGSVFKLFVYLAALEAGYSPQSMVTDQPLEIWVGRKLWKPGNFDGEFRGEIPLYMALTHSVNTVAVQLIQTVGAGRVVEMAKRLGIPRAQPNLSLALGTTEATLVELAGAFAHLANEGNGVKPFGIEKIVDKNGEVLYERKGVGLWAALRPGIVHQMNYMLANVVRAGTGTRANIGRPVAGKTGTSSDFKDAWFVGFIPQLVTGVWVGNDNNTPMKKVTGGNIPAMIWHDYMIKAVAGMPIESIPQNDTGSFLNLPWLQGGEQSGAQTDSTGHPEAVPQFEGQTEGEIWQNQQATPTQDEIVIEPSDETVVPNAAVNAPVTDAPAAAPTEQPANPPVDEVNVEDAFPNMFDDKQTAPESGLAPDEQAPAAPKPAEPKKEEGALGQKFWNTLMDKAKQVEVEYDYPNKKPPSEE